MAIATVQALTKSYGMPGTDARVHALRGIDIDFAEGESVAICGQSGSGKSTLMNLLGCLDRPTDGLYRLGDTNVSDLDDDQLSDIRGRCIGFVFQSFNLIAQLTVLENLEVPMFYQRLPSPQRRARAMELAEIVGLGDRMYHRPAQLSGGQQQRAAIARSLMNDPLIILADEPTGNLDTATGEHILSVFADLREKGKTIVIVTHSESLARRCDRIITLRDGLIVSDVRGSGNLTSGRS